MAMKAPAAGAAVRSPKPTGPTRKTSRASAGKTAVGMPKIIASRSIANVDRIRRLERTNWIPSRIAARPPRAGPPRGGIGRILTSMYRENRYVATSAANAPPAPTVPSSTPATIGPITDPRLKVSWPRAIAARRRVAGTSRGIAEVRAGQSIADRPDATNATRKRAGSDTSRWTEIRVRATLVRARPSCVKIRTRRRSTASAMAPPPSEKSSSGMSWTRVSAATAVSDPVPTKTTYGNATRVMTEPMVLTA